jgi:putative membrane protein
VLIIFGLVALVKWIFFTGSSGTGTSGRNALDMLKERYARGEINREQYEEMRRNLQS